jgi:hypothetical protein
MTRKSIAPPPAHSTAFPFGANGQPELSADASTAEVPASGATAGTPDPAAGAAPGPDPFDLDAMRLPQDFLAAEGCQKVLTVSVRKPHKSWFIRVHPDQSYRVQAGFVELEMEADRGGELYYVAPRSGRSWRWNPPSRDALFTAVSRQGSYFLWPVKLPGDGNGRGDSWHRSALEAATVAMKNWVRITANQEQGVYDRIIAPGTIPEPRWPDKSFKELLRIGFKGRVIDSWDHPILCRLRGEE